MKEIGIPVIRGDTIGDVGDVNRDIRTENRGRRIYKILALFALLLIVGIVACVITGCSLSDQYASENVIIQTTQNTKRDYLIRVNKDNVYDFEGAYAKLLEKDMVTFTQALYGDVNQLEKAAYQAFCQLQIALAEKDIAIGILSGYRSYEDQEYLYNLDTSTQTAPGYSEHHTGLNISMVVWSDLGEEGWAWASEGGRIPENETISSLLPEFGFIRRYPEGKEEVTGVSAKPYEIRYVGREAAKKIAKQGLALEEYLKK